MYKSVKEVKKGTRKSTRNIRIKQRSNGLTVLQGNKFKKRSDKERRNILEIRGILETGGKQIKWDVQKGTRDKKEKY